MEGEKETWSARPDRDREGRMERVQGRQTVLFQLSDLPDEEKWLLRHALPIPSEGLAAEDFAMRRDDPAMSEEELSFCEDLLDRGIPILRRSRTPEEEEAFNRTTRQIMEESLRRGEQRGQDVQVELQQLAELSEKLGDRDAAIRWRTRLWEETEKAAYPTIDQIRSAIFLAEDCFYTGQEERGRKALREALAITERLHPDGRYSILRRAGDLAAEMAGSFGWAEEEKLWQAALDGAGERY